MNRYEKSKLLNDSSVLKFVTRWTDLNDLSRVEYSAIKKIRFKTSMLR